MTIDDKKIPLDTPLLIDLLRPTAIATILWKPYASPFLPVETPEAIFSAGWVLGETEYVIVLASQFPTAGTMPMLIRKASIIYQTIIPLVREEGNDDDDES